MRYVKITYEELSVLTGLPHLQQLLYLRGIRPYMDYRTGIVGIIRGISYQSLAEELYVEPHQGIKSGSPSKDQIRRAIKGLEKAGLLRVQSMHWKLVFQCLLAAQDFSNLNKPATNPHDHCATMSYQEIPLQSHVTTDLGHKGTTFESDKAAIPQDNNKYYIFLLQQFEKFWTLYPLKKSKQSAWSQFQALRPNDELLRRIFIALEMQTAFYNELQRKGQWVPGWKFPANWLAQECWEDEINENELKEQNHAKYQEHHTPQQSVDSFWDSCKDGAYFREDNHNNIIELNGARDTKKTC